MHVKILGFTDNQIEMYVRGCFKEESNKAQQLWEIIQRNPRLLENCYLPLLLIIIVHLYKYRKPRALPESFCGIIIELALSCLYRHYRREGIFDDEDVDPLPSFDAIEIPKIRCELEKLCEAAYDATLKDKYTFSNPAIDGLGLLQNVCSTAVRGSEITQYFLHLSLQELCAALYVAWQPILEQKELLERLFTAPHDYVLRFYSALTHWKNESVCEVLLKHTKNIKHEMEKSLALPVPLSFKILKRINNLIQHRKIHQAHSLGGLEMGNTTLMQELTETQMMKWSYESQNPHKPIMSQQLVTPLLGQKLISSFVYEKRTLSTLMLLHCIYEANNPQLATLLAPSLLLIGNLNSSDLLALQHVFQKGSGIEHFYLITTISPNYMNIIAEAIAANKTIKKLYFDVTNDETQDTSGHKYDCEIPDEKKSIKSYGSFNSNTSGFKQYCGTKELAKALKTTNIAVLDLSTSGIDIKELLIAPEDSIFSLHLHDMIILPAALESLSRSLVENSTLKFLGLVDDPLTSELTKGHFQQFVVHLCFNSSLTCLLLNGQYIHTPSMQQALSLVNFTRTLKQQPLLSINDHFPKNYYPELCNEFGIRPWEIRTKALINCTTETMSNTCHVMEELPAQEWTKTLHFTLHFIAQIKAIGNMSVRHVLKPHSKAVCINIQSKIDKPRGETLVEIEAQRILFPKKQLPLQEHQQTLCGSLQFITRFKAAHAICLSTLQPRKTVRGKDPAEINIHLQNPSSQYPAVVEVLQKQRPFSSQEWQQTLFCTQQFIHRSKAVRNMCINKLLGASNKIYIRFCIQQHCIRECSITNSIMCRENEINVQRKFEDHVHNVKCMAILLSVITTPNVDTRLLQYCPPTAANRENPEIFLCKDHIKKLIAVIAQIAKVYCMEQLLV